MTTTAAKKVDYRKRSKAMEWAVRRAKSRLGDGFGSGPEAMSEWKWFAANIPELAAHVDGIAWMRAYRSCPEWAAVHARCGKGPDAERFERLAAKRRAATAQ